jgi:hypothetical protein
MNDWFGPVSQGDRRFIDARSMHSIGPAIGVPGNHDMHPPGYDQPSNAYAIMGAISPAQPSPKERRAFTPLPADANALDRSASTARTPFGEKTLPPPPKRRTTLSSPLASAHALDRSTLMIGTSFGEKTLPPPPYQA